MKLHECTLRGEFRSLGMSCAITSRHASKTATARQMGRLPAQRGYVCPGVAAFRDESNGGKGTR